MRVQCLLHAPISRKSNLPIAKILNNPLSDTLLQFDNAMFFKSLHPKDNAFNARSLIRFKPEISIRSNPPQPLAIAAMPLSIA